MKHQGPGAMNRVYRLVWNESAGAFVAVSEVSTGRRKRSGSAARAVAAVLLVGAVAQAQAAPPAAPAPTALPAGGTLAQGQAQWTTNGARLDVTQGSARAVIHWQRFDIGSQAQVNFTQPSAAAVAVNRVTGADPSAIFGRLSANGQVVLVNPNGIAFGAGSQVDVGGLVASTLGLADADAMAGRFDFRRGAVAGAVTNAGTLHASDGGYVALLAPQVRNDGVVRADLGTVALAGGDVVSLALQGSRLLGVKVDASTVDTLIENRQLLQADGGQVLLAAGAAQQLLQQAVAGGGGATTMEAGPQGSVRLVASTGTMSAAGGRVEVLGGNVNLAGRIGAVDGGAVQVQADYVGQSGTVDVSSAHGAGGRVQVQAGTLVQTAQAAIVADGATAGGSVRLDAGTGVGAAAPAASTLYSSAHLSARGLGEGAAGGDIALGAGSVQLRAATVDATGSAGGGRIRIGGGFHGADADLGNAGTVGVNAATVLRADATGASGAGGQVVVWSDQKTLFAGTLSATGGRRAGDGGQAEVSGRADLVFQGAADLGAPGGNAGRLLLDPRNIIVDNAGAALASLAMSDPTPNSGYGFGSTVKVLGNGNVVVTAPSAETGATVATGAAYLFDSTTGALLANLRGSAAGDQVGSGGVQVLGNGNYLVLSPEFGTVSNRYVFGFAAQDSSGTRSAPAPSAYAVQSATTASAGAITWQSATGSGAALVGAANSLVGSTANTDSVSLRGYSGNTVTTGATVSATANDRLGGADVYDSGGNYVVRPGTRITELTDGNAVVAVPTWNNGRGAVAWINGATGALVDGSAGGTVSASTALVGSTPNRTLAPVSTAVSNASLKVYVTGVDASLPYTFTDNSQNRRSTPPGAPGDMVGTSVTALDGGGYVVGSPLWTDGAATFTGAATWAGAGGRAGAVGSGNSLVGSSAYDFVASGGVTRVGTSGANYLVDSPYWSGNGNTAAGRYLENSANGAVTWVAGATGVPYGAAGTGAAVGVANSLIGGAGDFVGSKSNAGTSPYAGYEYNSTTYALTYTTALRTTAQTTDGLKALKNGNYLVVDNAWSSSKGAVAFGDGGVGLAGSVSASNALVGATGGDQVGQTVVELSGSHYAVLAPGWDNGAAVDAGAVTWGSGSSGRTGTVGSGNSLVGSGAYDAVGSGGVLAVGATGGNGLRSNYLVLSPQWGNRGGAAATTVAYGAVTWVDGSNGQPYGAGATGAAVGSANSLVGSHAGDYVGSVHYADGRSWGGYSDGFYQSVGAWNASLSAAVDVLGNGDYLVRSPGWDGGKGAATLGAGASGVAGAVSATNSLVGTVADVVATSTATQSRGGYTWTDTTRSLTTTGDHVGLLGGALSGGSALVVSPFWGSGKGAVTWVGSGNASGTVGAGNSLVGSTADSFTDANHSALSAAGDRLGTLANTSWVTPVMSEYVSGGNTNATALTRPVGPYATVTGYNVNSNASVFLGKGYSVQAPVSLAITSDEWGGLYGSFQYNVTPIYRQLGNGNVLVASPSWNASGAAAAGAVSWLDGSTGHWFGGSAGAVLSAANSLVGSHAGDLLGYRLPLEGLTELANGNFVLANPQWYDERGAVTWGSGTAGVAGTVSAANSLVGSTGSAVTGLTATSDYISRYLDGRGWIYDWPDRVSDRTGDRVGYAGVTALADGNAVVASPFWASSAAWTQTAAPSSKGAATWLNGSTGRLIDGSTGGAVAAANSLVGTVAGDAVGYSAYVDPNSGTHYAYGGVTALAGGRYVVASPWWSNGAATGVGAVTFGAAGGIAGAVSTANSLVGATAGDHIGRSLSAFDATTWISTADHGVQVVTAGGQTNYVVRSADWTNPADRSGGGAGAGAVTWVDGSTGRAYGEGAVGAVVGPANSLVGATAGDALGAQSLALKRTVGASSVATGDLLFFSAYDDCGDVDAGAATLLSGRVGAAGTIGWRNSLIGLAPASNAQNTASFDGYSYATDLRALVLPAAVTAAEQVAWRPLVWAVPNATSGKASTQVMALTLVDEAASGGRIVDPVHNAGGANWTGSLYAGSTAGFTALGGDATTGLLGFSASGSADVVITPATLTGLLDAGTAVTLQASNDITVSRAITVSAGGHGGNLTLQAGRSIRLDANITTDNGNFSAIANETVAHGVVDAACSACVSEIVQRAGTTLDAGTGQLALRILKATDKSHDAAGDLVLASVLAGKITAANAGLDANALGRGLRFQTGAVVGSTATDALTLQAMGAGSAVGGIVLAADTQLVGGAAATLSAAAADASAAARFGTTGGGFAMSAAEIGTLLTQSSGFASLTLGRADQSGATTLGALNLNQASMRRGGTAALDLDLMLQGGSGGLALGGAVTSGEASGRTLTLAVTDGTLALGSASVAATGGNLGIAAQGSSATVTQTAGGVSATRLLASGTGTVTMSAGSNAVGTLAANVGGLTLKNAASTLTVGSVGGVAGVIASSGVTLQAAGASSDLVLDQPVANAAGDLVLAAGRNFVNNTATDTGLQPGSGRYLVYSTNPTASTEAMTGYGKHYAQGYTAGSTPAYAGSGNWFLYSVAPTLAASVGAGSTITYGDPGAAPGVSLSGFIDGDTQASATTGSLASTTSGYTPSGAGFIPVGTYTVSLTGAGTLASSLGYAISVTTGSSSFTVQPKAITVTGLSAANKVYDGTTAATITGTAAITGGGSSNGDGRTLAGDTVSVGGSAGGSFATRHAGTGKSVVLSGLSLTGADAGNYTISAGSVSADITPKALTLAGLSVAASRAYDGGTSATVLGSAALATAEAAGAGSTADGKPYSGDTVSVTGTPTATYDAAGVAAATGVQFGGVTLAGAQAGNYTLSAASQAATITPKALTVTGTSVAAKVYDGGTTATLSGGTLVGVVGADGVTLTQAGSFANKNIGTAKAVTAADTLGGADAGNYTLTQPTGLSADITAKALTVSGTAVASKVYDGGTAATLSGGTLVGVVGSDAVTLTQAGSFANRNVGTAKAVTAADTLGGADAGNYTLTQPTGLSADITAKSLTVSGTSVAGKVYDGGTTATLSGGTLVGVVGADVVTLTQAGSFADKNIGVAKAVTAADTLGGAGAGNYTLTQPTGLTADISAKALTVSGTTVAAEVYDGSTTATLSGGTLVGVVGADVVTLTQAGSFADRNVGGAKAVTAADTLGGAGAGNYTLTQPTGLSADITAKALTVAGTAVASKVYDGGTSATLSGGTLVGVVGSDAVTLTQAGSFANKNVGSAKAVAAADTLAGTDAGNYTLTQPTGLAADITAKALTVTGSTVANKVYDGSLTANVSGGTLVGVVGADVVTLTQAGSFADAHAGTARPVTAADSLGGAGAGNYTLTQPTGLAADITAKALTVTGTTVAGKVYDGGTAATLSGGTLVGVVGADVVTLTQAGSFANKNVGSAKAVTAADTLGGAGAGDYTLTQPTGLSADITAKTLTVTGTAVASKVYDGGTAATLSGGTLVGVVGSDAVTLTQAGSFANRNVGSAKPVTAADALAGTDAGNYTLTQPTGLAGDITAKPLTVSGTMVAGKVYDGGTVATLTGGTLVGVVGADVVTLTQAGSFADRHAGSAKAVTAADTLGGAGAGNYTLVQPTGLAADIAPKTLTVSGTTVAAKVYDGGTVATLSGGTLVGVVDGDAVTLAQAGSFANRRVGAAKAVTAADTIAGADAGNYALAQPTGLAADVTPKTLTVTGTAVANKVYDGGLAATLSGGTLVGVVDGDTVTLAQAGSFANRNVGAAKAVTAADTIAGADAGNYALAQPTGLSADVTPKTLTVTGTVVANKVYDGGTVATLTGGTLAGVVDGDTVTLAQAGSFADKRAGAGKAVTAADAIAGADAGNYTLTQPTGLTAEVTPKTLTVTGTTAAGKTYDGSPAATLSGGTLVGVVDGDAVTLTQAGSFANRNAGTAKAITAADAIGGADAGNYALVQPTGLAADVAPKAVTVTGTTVVPRAFDGGTAATLIGGTLAGVVAGDTVTLVQAGQFADRNVGAAKPVTAADSLAGADAGNYAITQPTGLTATVSGRSLTVVGTTAAGKVYDGGTAATLTGGTLVGVVDGDVVTLTQAGSFADKHVGNAKAVTAADTLGGAGAANYVLAQPTGLAADITPRPLAVSGVTAQSKVYDGSTAATLDASRLVLDGLVPGDRVAVAVQGAFADPHAGSGKTVAIASQRSGADLANYSVSVQATASADVLPRSLTVVADAQRKVYGAADPALGYTLGGEGLVAGESAAGVLTGALATATGAAATAGTHAITQGTLDAASGDYRITVMVPGVLTVAKAPLTVSADDQNKTAGEKDPTLAYTVTAAQLQYQDTPSVVREVVLQAPTGAGVPPGSYPIRIVAGTADNYALAFNDGVLTVKPSPAVKSENLQSQAGGGASTSSTVVASFVGAGAAGGNAAAPGSAAGSGSLGIVGGGVSGGGAGAGAGAGSATGAGAGTAVGSGSGTGPAAAPGTGSATGSATGAGTGSGTGGVSGAGAGAAGAPSGGATAAQAAGRLATVRPEVSARGAELATGIACDALFSRPDGLTVSYSAAPSAGGSLPAWLSIDSKTGVLRGTPPAELAGQRVEITVSIKGADGQLASTQVVIEAAR